MKSSEIKLTKEQQNLVAQNHNIIFDILTKRNLPIWTSDTYHNEDWYGIAATSLCQAAATFDESLGYTFSTYAYKCITNAINSKFIVLNAKHRIPPEKIISGDYSYISDDGDECTLFDSLSAITTPEYAIIYKLDLEKQLEKESERTQNIIYLLSQKYTLDEIAKIHNVTRERVRQIKNKFLIRAGYSEYAKTCSN